MKEPPAGAERPRIHEAVREYDGVYKLLRDVVQEPLPGGGLGPKVNRLVFERGDAVAVLLYDPERDVVILTRQFRYPVYLRDGDGWTLEIVAGTIQPDADAQAEARRETLEEVGYRADRLEPIARFFPSPGSCSERVHLLCAVVSQRDRANAGGGIAEEGEVIEVAEFPAATALDEVMAHSSGDAKTLVALGWLEKHRERLREG